ncbi:Na/Pi cotransporter family protein [Halopseudomonas pelagia]|uniref:Na/Pi cotransporter family protein n=1 Tax=Halopseudomonas pelagia TaxID=553151 RepID=A0AA91Z5Q9_9GAMM|nr:Na/Pi symporter [Halopseudomonas pelagia]PCC99016.1 sodium:phosphate symporter [Halopseudomonas pelagia]QFY55392.1 Na/Pi cotransporter family protein [Halopseudomonas pelagia]
MRVLFKPLWVPVVLLVLVFLFVWKPELATLAAGIALFMLGMFHLEDGFRAFTGGALERWLKRSTNRLWKSLLFGITSTALVQSSSLVTVLSIAFLSAGMISLVAGIGIVFGANLGTTTGAWLIALVGLKVDLAVVAMPLLVFGVLLGRRMESLWKGAGQVLLGMGLLFLGIDLMKDGFASFDGLLALDGFAVEGWAGVVLYALLGLVATILMQSSHAAMMITLAALASGQLAYGNALAMAIGANLGTTVTALLAALGSNNAGRRLAAAHILFNLVTALVALAILPSLTRSVDWLAEVLGIAADAYTLKLALFHTLFNVLGLAIMLPWIPLMVKWLMRWLPDVTSVGSPRERHAALSEQPRMRARFLNDSALQHADTALKVLGQEVQNLGALSRQVIAAALYLPAGNLSDLSREQLHKVVLRAVPEDHREDADALYERHVKGVYADIIDFISRMDLSLTPDQQQALMDYNAAARELIEAVKAAKHLQSNLRKQIDSRQPAIHEAYDLLREQGGQALVDMGRLMNMQGDTEARGELFGAYEEQERLFADHFQQTIQTRLRNRELDGWQASSMLNDLHYLLRVRQHLYRAHAELHDQDAQVLSTSPTGRIEPSLSLP